MMSGVILAELRTLCTAFVCGAAVTFVYDLLRIFRRVIPHGNLWIAAEDLFFWLWTAFRTFSVLYRENDGSLRTYTLFTMVAGMLIYNRTVSGVFVEITGKITKIPIIFCRNKLQKLYKGIIINKIHHRKDRKN